MLAFLVLGGCHHEDTSKPDPLLTQSATKDPNDYSSLRKFPLNDLLQSEVKVAGRVIPVWVMDTPDKEAEGFMFLREKDVPDGHGMIFVMEKEAQQGFFMRNCFMELDIAFISAKGKVLNVARGRKLDESNLPSKGPAKYVLELKPGEAAKFGVKTGATIEIPLDLSFKP
jgi:uncharacterized membrane protein (UPF0127 family)